MIKGNHLFQFGGSYQRNYDFHMRIDNGAGHRTTRSFTRYHNSGINFGNFAYPDDACRRTSSPPGTRCMREALGLVNQPQVVYTRSGPTSPATGRQHAFDQSIIPYYDVYFSDTWHAASRRSR